MKLSDQPSVQSEKLRKLEEYYISVLETVVDGIAKVLKAKEGGLINQKHVADKMMKELKENQDQVMEAFLFSVKPSFRDFFMGAVDRIIESVASE